MEKIGVIIRVGLIWEDFLEEVWLEEAVQGGAENHDQSLAANFFFFFFLAANLMSGRQRSGFFPSLPTFFPIPV